MNQHFLPSFYISLDYRQLKSDFKSQMQIEWKETMKAYLLISGAPNEYFSENGPLTTENQNLDAFKAFSSTFLCCWKEFICSPLPAG